MYAAIALSSADAMRRDIPVIAPRNPLDAALRLMQESASRRSAWQRIAFRKTGNPTQDGLSRLGLRHDKSKMLRNARRGPPSGPPSKEAAPCRPFSLSQPADTALSPTSSNILAGLPLSPQQIAPDRRSLPARNAQPLQGLEFTY